MNTHASVANYGYYINRTLAAAAATLLTTVWLAAAQPAQAGTVPLASARVSYADLNLGSEAGAHTLYQRLKGAASRVCGTVDHRSPARRQCYDKALGDAVHSVGAPRLVALHGARAGRQVHGG
jgi:UrcA family protein